MEAIPFEQRKAEVLEKATSDQLIRLILDAQRAIAAIRNQVSRAETKLANS
jgi:hypothetical protein